MSEEVIKKNQVTVQFSEQGEVSHSNLHQAKFAAATKEAESLLKPSVTFDISDSLNCGKFNTKFLKGIMSLWK